jgi:hypothetical protein
MSTSDHHVDSSESEEIRTEREIHPSSNGRLTVFAGPQSLGQERVPVKLIEAWTRWAESRLR